MDEVGNTLLMGWGGEHPIDGVGWGGWILNSEPVTQVLNLRDLLLKSLRPLLEALEGALLLLVWRPLLQLFLLVVCPSNVRWNKYRIILGRGLTFAASSLW